MRTPFIFACLFGGLILCNVSVFAQRQDTTESVPPAVLDTAVANIENSPKVLWPDAIDFKVRERLNTRISGNWKDISFKEAMHRLATELEIEIELDPQGLEEAGDGLDQSVNYSFDDQVAKRVLISVLAPLHLDFFIRSGSVVITSVEKRSESFQTRLYNIRDLLDSPWTKQASAAVIPSGTKPISAETPKIGSSEHAAQESKTSQEQAAGEIIDLITTSIAPDSWTDKGGQASVAIYRGMLMIVQTEDAHDRIWLTLQQLRKAEASDAGDVIVLP